MKFKILQVQAKLYHPLEQQLTVLTAEVTQMLTIGQAVHLLKKFFPPCIHTRFISEYLKSSL